MRGRLGVASLCFLVPPGLLVLAKNTPRRQIDVGTSNNVGVAEGPDVPAAGVGEAAVGAEERGQSETSRKRTRSLPLPERSVFFSGSANKRPPVGSRPLWTITVVVVGLAVLSFLRRLEDVLSKCLTEKAGVWKQRNGSTARSLSSSQNDDLCGRGLEDASGAGGGRSVFWPGFRRLIPRPRGLSLRSGVVLMVVLALVILAFILSRPRTGAVWEQIQPTLGAPSEHVEGGQRIEYDDGWRFPVLRKDESLVSHGKRWMVDGVLFDGAGPPIRFSTGGVTYEMYLSQEMFSVLEAQGMLEEVRSALSVPPKLVHGEIDKLVWGRSGGSGDSVLICDGIRDTAFPSFVSQYEVYLPRGVFGISEDGALPPEHGRQAWKDLKALIGGLSASMYKIKSQAQMRSELFSADH